MRLHLPGGGGKGEEIVRKSSAFAPIAREGGGGGEGETAQDRPTLTTSGGERKRGNDKASLLPTSAAGEGKKRAAIASSIETSPKGGCRSCAPGQPRTFVRMKGAVLEVWKKKKRGLRTLPYNLGSHVW